MLDIGLEDSVTERFSRSASRPPAPDAPAGVATREVDHLLIGGGLAAATARGQLREEGADGTILLVGREPDPPYDRPAAVQGLPARRGVRARGRPRAPGEWWDENDVELLTRTSVMKLDAGERVATLSSKEEVRFGKALLATGANVRRLRADGSDLDGIHYLRAFANSDAIREDVAEAERVVLIGGSYIGCEVAASLVAGFGVKCSIVMQEDVTLERQFGRGGRRLLPGRARGARGGGARRRRARALRGLRRPGGQGGHQGRRSSWTATAW